MIEKAPQIVCCDVIRHCVDFVYVVHGSRGTDVEPCKCLTLQFYVQILAIPNSGKLCEMVHLLYRDSVQF